MFLFPCLVIHHVTTQIYLVTPWESQPKGMEAVTKTLKRVKIYIYWKQNIEMYRVCSLQPIETLYSFMFFKVSTGVNIFELHDL